MIVEVFPRLPGESDEQYVLKNLSYCLYHLEGLEKFHEWTNSQEKEKDTEPNE